MAFIVCTVYTSAFVFEHVTLVIFEAALMESLPKRVCELIPAPEPKSPSNGFLVNVAYPYTSPGSKQRVIQAIDENTISSSSSVVN